MTTQTSDETIKMKATLSQVNIPGPAPMQLFGWRGNFTQFLRDPIAYMRKLYRTYGEISCLVKGEKSMIFAFGPEYNQLVLTNPSLFLNAGIAHPGPKNSANRRVSFGLLSMNGAQHKRHRQLTAPPLHNKAMSKYHDSIINITQTLLENWATESKLDIWVEMKRLTKLISSSLLFGLDDPSEVMELSDVFEQWQDMNISIPVRLFQVNFIGSPYYKMLKLAEELEEKTIKMINRKRANILPDATDILSIFLQARGEDGNLMTEEELVGQINFLFQASYETSSNSLTWTLFLLSQHPKIMRDVFDELHQVLDGKPPTIEQLNQLPLLERVIKESMRLLAPPAYSYRVTSQAVELGPYQIQKGSTIAFSHYMTHHMPELFPNPNQFMPERWLSINPSPYEYLPFGAGAHSCLGSHFALMSMKIALAAVLQRFRLTVIPNSRIDRKVLALLAPKYGMPMMVQKQDREFEKSKTAVRGNIHEMVDLK